MENLSDEFKKQLHKQYATNINAHRSSFISFIATIITLVGAFGYVFANTRSYCYTKQYPENTTFTYNDLLLMAIFVLVMLCFLSILCLIIGYGQRRDKEIIDKYRAECQLESYSTNKKCYCSFIPDYYNAFFMLFEIVQLLVGIALIFKYYSLCPCANACARVITLTKVGWCATFFIPWFKRFCYYCKYINLK